MTKKKPYQRALELICGDPQDLVDARAALDTDEPTAAVKRARRVLQALRADKCAMMSICFEAKNGAGAEWLTIRHGSGKYIFLIRRPFCDI